MWKNGHLPVSSIHCVHYAQISSRTLQVHIQPSVCMYLCKHTCIAQSTYSSWKIWGRERKSFCTSSSTIHDNTHMHAQTLTEGMLQQWEWTSPFLFAFHCHIHKRKAINNGWIMLYLRWHLYLQGKVMAVGCAEQNMMLKVVWLHPGHKEQVP